jgi:hypothetical protein
MAFRISEAVGDYACEIIIATLLFTLLGTRTAFPIDAGENWASISIVNQTPTQLLFLQPTPDRADILPKGRGSIKLNTTITNTLISQKSAHYTATVDMEVIRTSLEMGYGVTSRLELGLSLPVSHYYAGFMDKPIIEVERMSGKIRATRDEEEPNRFAYVIKKDDKVFISSSKNSIGMGDLVLTAKVKIWGEGNILPGLSTKLSVKLPTGDNDRAFGSGEVDWGFGLLLKKNLNKMSAYLNGNVIFPGDAFDDTGISLREFYTFMLGAAYQFTPRLSAMAQMNWITKPFKNTGLDVLDKRIFDLLMGITYHTENSVFVQVGGIEDIFDSSEAGADFTFFLNVGMSF